MSGNDADDADELACKPKATSQEADRSPKPAALGRDGGGLADLLATGTPKAPEPAAPRRDGESRGVGGGGSARASPRDVDRSVPPRGAARNLPRRRRRDQGREKVAQGVPRRGRAAQEEEGQEGAAPPRGPVRRRRAGGGRERPQGPLLHDGHDQGPPRPRVQVRRRAHGRLGLPPGAPRDDARAQARGRRGSAESRPRPRVPPRAQVHHDGPREGARDPRLPGHLHGRPGALGPRRGAGALAGIFTTRPESHRPAQARTAATRSSSPSAPTAARAPAASARPANSPARPPGTTPRARAGDDAPPRDERTRVPRTVGSRARASRTTATTTSRARSRARPATRTRSSA